MKVGAENRNKLIAAVALALVAVVLVGRSFLATDSSPAPNSAAAAPSSGSPATSKTRIPSRTKNPATKKAVAALPSLDPTLRFDLLASSEATQYSGNGRNIFESQQVEIPKPIAPAVTQAAPPPGPPPPPPPPPINLVFFGFASKPGEPKSVFLSEGGDVFVAREGQIIDRRYRIVRISPMAVEVEDVLNNNRQSIPLTQG